MWALALLLVIGGCGRLDFVPRSDADIDAAVPAPDVSLHCGGAGLLADTFTGQLDSFVWSIGSTGAATASIVNDELEIALPNGGAVNEGVLVSRYTYDMRDDGVAVRVPSTPRTGTNAQAHLRLVYDDKNWIQIVWELDALHFQYKKEDVLSTIRFVPYDPVADAYWRIREANGTVVWETSPDDATFTVQASAAAPFDVSALYIELGSDTYQVESNPGTVVFDDVHGITLGGAYCSMAVLTDDFADGMTGHRWTEQMSPGCAVSETGTLKLTVPLVSGASCAYATRALYDLSQSPLLIDAINVPITSQPTQLVFGVASRGGTFLFVEETGTLQLRRQPANQAYAVVGTASYSAVAHRQWRLRVSGSLIVGETSDGATSVTFGQGDVFASLVDVRIHVGNISLPTMASTVEVDNLNL